MRNSVYIWWIVGFCVVLNVSSWIRTDAQENSVEAYVVQYGDTLWDIANVHLNNPYRWHEIHRNNPHIVNPNLIYPGDLLGLASGLAGDAQQGKNDAEGRTKLSDKAIARPWYGLPAPQAETVETPDFPGFIVPSSEMIESNGYIVPYTIKQLQSERFGQITGAELGDGDVNSQIIASEYGQPGLVFGDTIYINRGTRQEVRQGDMFFAFRPVRELQHPFTAEAMGTQIEILGRFRIKSVESQVACAEIMKSYYYMEIGSPIMPVSELSVPLAKPLVGDSRSYGLPVGNQLIGHIIAERVGRRAISYGDIVFLDIGAAQGVQPSDNFIIYREVGDGFPKQAIGRVTILSAREQTSTAIVAESAKTIEIGEKIVLLR